MEKNAFKVSAVKLDSRFEQQSALAGAVAVVAALSASSAYAKEATCGNLQNEPCPVCCTISWPF
jgi:hypothetical protein